METNSNSDTLPIEEWHRRYSEQANWTADLRRHLLGQVKLSHAGRVLEVGCGTGAVLPGLRSPLAPPPRREGDSRQGDHPTQIRGIFGIDIDRRALALARQTAPAAALACADAHHLPFANGCFDLVCCHFLLLWVADPRRVLHEMKRLARPGGIVLALAEPDYGGRVDYPPALAQVGAWQIASLQAQGADPFTGRRLGAWFTQAGLKDVQVGVMGGQWQPQNTNREVFVSEWQVIESDLAALPSPGVARQEADELRQLDERARFAGERILFVPTFYARGSAP